MVSTLKFELVNMTTHCIYSNLTSSLWQTHAETMPRRSSSLKSRTCDLFRACSRGSQNVKDNVAHSAMSNHSNSRQRAEVRHFLLFLLLYPSSSLILHGSPLLHSPCYSSSSLLIYHSGAAPLPNCLGVKMRFCVKADNKSIPWNTGFSTLIKHIPHVRWQIN